MKRIKKLLTIGLTTAALSSFSIAAQAWEPTFYAGGNIGSAQHDSHKGSGPFTVLSIEGLGGINLLPYLSVEARFGLGYNEDRRESGRAWDPINEEWATAASSDLGYDLRENYYASIYLRPSWSNETASIYGLLGATTVELSSNQAWLEDSDTGASYGFGVSFKINSKVNVNAEWKKQISAEDFDIEGATVGFIYNF